MSHLKIILRMQSILGARHVPVRVACLILTGSCWRRLLADKAYDMHSLMLIQSLWTASQYVTPHQIFFSKHILVKQCACYLSC